MQSQTAQEIIDEVSDGEILNKKQWKELKKKVKKEEGENLYEKHDK